MGEAGAIAAAVERLKVEEAEAAEAAEIATKEREEAEAAKFAAEQANALRDGARHVGFDAVSPVLEIEGRCLNCRENLHC